MPRSVQLTVCAPDGQWGGELPEFQVENPWWSDVEPICVRARQLFGVELTVLRMLTVLRQDSGDAVRYLVRLDGALPGALRGSGPGLLPSAAGRELAHPRRVRWATPDGFDAIVQWADTTLAGLGRPRLGPVVQTKTWNLSGILRLPTADGDVWCKSTPLFLGDEGAIMTLLAGPDAPFVPDPLAYDSELKTVLLADVPGEDQWQAPAGILTEMVRLLVGLQRQSMDRGDELMPWVADWRPPAFIQRAAALAERCSVQQRLSRSERTGLADLVAGLPARFAALEACGLPDTLVHGDFHPGNWRLGPAGLQLLDWGETAVGHPLLSVPGFLSWAPEADRDQVRRAWLDAWRSAVPGSDPGRALRLLPALAALRGALIYQQFLDGIEPDEYPYHWDDVPAGIRAALASR